MSFWISKSYIITHRPFLRYWNFKPLTTLENTLVSLSNMQEPSNQQFQSIVDKVQSKLMGWKAKLLPFAGYTTLVQLVTLTISDYYMQGEALPIRVRNNIDNINWNFLWGSSEEHRRLHLVGWKKLVTSKEARTTQVARPNNLTLLANSTGSWWMKKMLCGWISLLYVLFMVCAQIPSYMCSRSASLQWCSIIVWLYQMRPSVFELKLDAW